MSSERIKCKLTPPELASRWGISVDKVMTWIRSGELRAINAASAGRNHRPRFLIDLDDIADFERRREVVPPPPKARRQHRIQKRTDDRY